MVALRFDAESVIAQLFATGDGAAVQQLSDPTLDVEVRPDWIRWRAQGVSQGETRRFRMGTRRGASLLAVLALAGAGTLAACGGDDDDSSGEETTAESTGPST